MLGYLSAGTLGYIHGNIKGARRAVGLYKSYRNMPPIHRFKRKHHRQAVPAKTKRRRTLTIGHVKKRKGRSGHRKPKVMKMEGQSITHGAMLRESIRVGKKKRYSKKVDKGRWHYLQTHQQITVNSSGLQAVVPIVAVNTYSQILNSTGAGYAYYQNFTALQQLNPYLKTTGSTVIPATTVPLTDRFFLIRNILDVEVTNLSNIVAHADFYLCRCKSNTGSDPTTVFTAAATYESNGVAKQLFGAAGSALGATGGGADIRMVGTKPTSFKTFNDEWKVMEVNSVELPGDSTKKLNYTINVEKTVKTDDLNAELQFAGGLLFKKGYTYVLFHIMRGGIVRDNTAGGTGVATYGSAELGIITTVKTVMAPIRGNAGRLNETYQFDSLPTGATAANQGTINEIDAPTFVQAA